jgi:NDP-sugar pyrophosphorylase family protein
MEKKIDQIIILNGGSGSRVKSIANGGPKCLIKINSKPFLYLQLNLIKKNNIKKVVICCGYKSELIVKEIKKKYIKDLNLDIQLSIEKKKLGTGGAILHAYKFLDDNFFIIYGDSWLDINFINVAKTFALSKKKGLMTLIKSSLVKEHRPNVIFKKNKIVEYNKNKKSIDFKFIDYGLIAMKKDILSKYNLNFINKKFDLKKIIKSMIATHDLVGYIVKTRFYTIGSPIDVMKIKKVIK